MHQHQRAEATQLKETVFKPGVKGRQDSGQNIRQVTVQNNSEKQKEKKPGACQLTKRLSTVVVRQKQILRRSLSVQDLSAHNRVFTQKQMSWPRICCKTMVESQPKIPAESRRCCHLLRQAFTQQNAANRKSSSSGAREGGRSAFGTTANRGQHSQLLQALRHRLAPENLEKKQYQQISEYQFMIPGKAFYHCTREGMKQHLRSIYLGQPSSLKLPKSARQTSWPTLCHREKQKVLRKNSFIRAPYPSPSKVLGDSSRLCTLQTPCGLMDLAHKVGKLVPVTNRVCTRRENPPQRRAANQSHVQQKQPSTAQLIPSAKQLQAITATKGKKNTERPAQELGIHANLVQQRSGRKALKSVQGKVTRATGGTLAKAEPIRIVNEKPGTGNSPAVIKVTELHISQCSVERKNMAGNLQELQESQDCQEPVTAHVNKNNVIIIPMLNTQSMPDASSDTELLPNTCLSKSPLDGSLAEERRQTSHSTTVSLTDPSFPSLQEQSAGDPKHCSSLEKGDECCISPAEALQESLDSENEKNVSSREDDLSVPFQEEHTGMDILFLLSDAEEEQ
ncbi:uncharacterized protein LOC109280251 isoform X2 [Alligator mississippiensis]|nr:uncharacterized protein LOC109280251 isoform X2 [Alligator mississippiensis]